MAGYRFPSIAGPGRRLDPGRAQAGRTELSLSLPTPPRPVKVRVPGS